jgi:hypothetical protein
MFPQDLELLLQVIPEAATNTDEHLILSYLYGVLSNKKEVNINFLTSLLNLGCKIDAKEKGWPDRTALMRAIMEPGSTDLIDFLVANGAKLMNVDWKNIVVHSNYFRTFRTDLTGEVSRLSRYRRYGLKYADLPLEDFKYLIPEARKLTEFEYYGLAELLKSRKNLPKSSSFQRDLHKSIAKYL